MEKQLIKIISDLKDRLPEPILESNMQLVTHGEPVVALENLCSQIDDYDIPISNEEFMIIKSLTKGAGLQDELWENLEKFIKK